MEFSRRLSVIAPTPFVVEGGASARVLGEVLALQRLGVGVDVLAYPVGTTPPGVSVRRPRSFFGSIGTGFHPKRALFDSQLLGLVLRRRQLLGLVHAHLHEGAAIGGLLRVLERRVSLVVDLQGSLRDELSRTVKAVATGAIGRLITLAERSLEAGADALIVSSPGMYEALRSRFGSSRTESVHLVDDGVDVTLYPRRDSKEAGALRAQIRQAYSIGDDETVAIYVGTISREQGIDALLEGAPVALRECRKLRFLVFGRTTSLNSLETYRRRAAELGVQERFHFPGPVKFEHLPSVLLAGDVAVTLKTSTYEANGKIPVYLASGLPVIAVKTPSAISYTEDSPESGALLVADAQSAQHALVDLARNGDRRSSMGIAAREWAEARLTWERRARSILAIHARAAEKSGSVMPSLPGAADSLPPPARRAE